MRYYKRKKKTVKSSFKKLKSGYVGKCELRQLAKGEYFRIIGKDGKVGKATYTKDYYVPSERKYQCNNHNDIWGNGRQLKGTTKVTTDFYY